jgi:hypothetical protein
MQIADLALSRKLRGSMQALQEPSLGRRVQPGRGLGFVQGFDYFIGQIEPVFIRQRDGLSQLEVAYFARDDCAVSMRDRFILRLYKLTKSDRTAYTPLAICFRAGLVPVFVTPHSVLA